MTVVLFLAAALACAQTDIEAPLVQTEHFAIYGDINDGETLARQMEFRFAIYNQVFRFDPAVAEAEAAASLPLRLRVFSNQEQYEGYVRARLGDVRPGAVYLHYNQAGRRELVLCTGSDDSRRALRYQAFIQFLRAFVPNPPVWIQEGFAAVFATLEFDANGEPLYEENLSWLDTVKSIPEKPSPLAIMQADTQAITEHFQGLAWSLVSFFLNSGNDNYTRSMTESFMLLARNNTVEENTGTLINRISMWNNMDELTEDYYHYLDARKSFAVLIKDGQDAYTEGRTSAATVAFHSAMELKPGHYAPYYYLGLLAYNAGDNESAETFYRSAMDYGADTALVLYALGLNAAVAGKHNDAITFLKQSAGADPERYREKADAVIAQLK
jgi:tetratricopeptide (TPR) repeat protein